MALFDNSSFGLRFNGTIPHPLGSPFSFTIIDIPQEVLQLGVLQGLSSVVFDMKVFDVNMNGDLIDRPAFEQAEVLEVELDEVELNPMVTSHIVGEKMHLLHMPMLQWSVTIVPVC